MTSGDTGVKIHVKTPALDERSPAPSISAHYLEPIGLPGGYGRIAVVSDPDGDPVGLWT